MFTVIHSIQRRTGLSFFVDPYLRITLTPDFLDYEKFYINLGTGAPPFVVTAGKTNSYVIDLPYEVLPFYGSYETVGRFISSFYIILVFVLTLNQARM